MEQINTNANITLDTCSIENSIYQSPILIQKENVQLCDALCNLQLVYPSTLRTITLYSKPLLEKKQLLYYQVDSNLLSKNLGDIVYNGVKYILNGIEIYIESVHRFKKDECIDIDDNSKECQKSYPLELCLYHKSISNDDIIAISISIIPKLIFSATQQCISDLLLILSQNDNLNTEEYRYIGNTNVTSNNNEHVKSFGNLPFNRNLALSYCTDYPWCQGISCQKINQNESCFLKSNTQSTYQQTNNDVYTKNFIKQSVMPSTWKPIELYPEELSFYSYRGGYFNKPCHNDSNAKLIWIVMEKPSLIHTDSFNIYKNIVDKYKFDGNNGNNYILQPLNITRLKNQLPRKLSYHGNNSLSSSVAAATASSHSPNTLTDIKQSELINDDDTDNNNEIMIVPNPNQNIVSIALWFIVIACIFVIYKFFQISTTSNVAMLSMSIVILLYHLITIPSVLHNYLILFFYIIASIILLGFTAIIMQEEQKAIVGMGLMFLICIPLGIIYTKIQHDYSYVTYHERYYYIHETINVNYYYITKYQKGIQYDFINYKQFIGIDNMHLINTQLFALSAKDKKLNTHELFTKILEKYDEYMHKTHKLPIKCFENSLYDTIDLEQEIFLDGKITKITNENIQEIWKSQLPELYSYLISD